MEIENCLKGGKLKSCKRMEIEGRHRERIKYEGSEGVFEDLDNIDTQEQVAVHMCGFGGIRIGNCFEGKPIGRAEVEVRVRSQEK